MIRKGENMNVDDLFEEYDINGEPIFFIDEDCTQPYTGHIEEYDRGFLCMEADVVEGFMEGIYKEYHFMKKELMIISNVSKNMTNGLSIEFFENGRVESISLAIDNYFFDSYTYDELGNLESEEKMQDNEDLVCFSENDLDAIKRIRKRFDLQQINNEILRDGINFDYGKYFKK